MKAGRKNFLIGIIAAGVLTLAGCSGQQAAVPAEPDGEQTAESDAPAVSGPEKEEPDDNAAAPAKQDTEAGLGTLRPDAAAYFESTYGDYLKKGGTEAEFLHGGRYIAKCPDLDAYAVYEGEWSEDFEDVSIKDSSKFLRLEGGIAAFFTGKAEGMTADELIKELEKNYTVTSEYRESAGTAYYVSAEDYLHIELISGDDKNPNAILEIACKEGENITPDSYCWIIPGAKNSDIFSEIPREFVFSSGAGGWSTDIEISDDGTFTGEFHDSNMGDTGEGYPNGSLYICDFSGKFSDPEPTDSPYIYSMKLLELHNENEEKTGTEKIVDGTLYIYSEPYGFDDADEFLIYMPGTPLSDVPQECRSWMSLSDSIFAELPDCYYVIYNIGGEQAFTGQKDGSVWYRGCRYDNGEAFVNFRPSYYMGSYLNFFTDKDSPALLSLTVPWDGKSREPMECTGTMNDDGTTVRVTIEPDEGSTAEVLKYVITAECISDPKFDFSAWGSSEPGKFSAVFTETRE